MTDSHKARFAGHTRHSERCDCGRLLTGNGRMTHQRACEPYLRAHGYPLAAGMVDGIRADLRDDRAVIEVPDRRKLRGVLPSDVLPGIRRRLADVVLERRAAGNRAALSWTELRPALAAAYAEALAELLAAHNGTRR